MPSDNVATISKDVSLHRVDLLKKMLRNGAESSMSKEQLDRLARPLIQEWALQEQVRLGFEALSLKENEDSSDDPNKIGVDPLSIQRNDYFTLDFDTMLERHQLTEAELREHEARQGEWHQFWSRSLLGDVKNTKASVSNDTSGKLAAQVKHYSYKLFSHRRAAERFLSSLEKSQDWERDLEEAGALYFSAHASETMLPWLEAEKSELEKNSDNEAPKVLRRSKLRKGAEVRLIENHLGAFVVTSQERESSEDAGDAERAFRRYHEIRKELASTYPVKVNEESLRSAITQLLELMRNS